MLIGAKPKDREELVGFQASFRESARNWRELITELKARGLNRSELK